MISMALPRLRVKGSPRNGPENLFAGARLTRKEAQLLMLLRQNEGQCLSREFLLQSVWGYQVGTRTRTLDVHILRLRRKLGASCILTIHRGGYMWCPDGEAEVG